MAPPVGFSPDILLKLSELETAVGAAIHGKPEVVRLSLVCLLAVFGRSAELLFAILPQQFGFCWKKWKGWLRLSKVSHFRR